MSIQGHLVGLSSIFYSLDSQCLGMIDKVSDWELGISDESGLSMLDLKYCPSHLLGLSDEQISKTSPLDLQTGVGIRCSSVFLCLFPVPQKEHTPYLILQRQNDTLCRLISLHQYYGHLRTSFTGKQWHSSLFENTRLETEEFPIKKGGCQLRAIIWCLSACCSELTTLKSCVVEAVEIAVR